MRWREKLNQSKYLHTQSELLSIKLLYDNYYCIRIRILILIIVIKRKKRVINIFNSGTEDARPL